MAILTPHGNLHEGEESARLERNLMRLLSRDVPRILVDLSRSGHLSARAIGIIASAHLEAMRRGSRLTVCGVRDEHRRLFEITGLAGVLDLRSEARPIQPQPRPRRQAVA